MHRYRDCRWDWGRWAAPGGCFWLGQLPKGGKGGAVDSGTQGSCGGLRWQAGKAGCSDLPHLRGPSWCLPLPVGPLGHLKPHCLNGEQKHSHDQSRGGIKIRPGHSPPLQAEGFLGP